MGKMNELSMLVDELRKCGETLVGLSEGLADLFSGTAEEEKQPVKRVLLKRKPPRRRSRKHRRKSR